MIVAWVLKMESPWSTPTQSEIGEAEAALHNPKGGFFLDPPGDRELGDGEPSFDANVDDYMAMAANNNIEGQDFADDLSQRSSSRGATTRGSKPKRSNSKSPEKRASRSPTKKGGRKGKKSNLGPGKNNFWKMNFGAKMWVDKKAVKIMFLVKMYFWPISQKLQRGGLFYNLDLQL